jgi:hypothetical protein
MKELLPKLIEAAAPLLLAVTSFIFARLGLIISAKVKSERIRTVGLSLNETAQDVVLELEQNVVSKMRTQSTDGTISAEDVSDLKRDAVVNLKRYLGAHGKADALKAFGFDNEEELEALLRAKIEAEVAKIKMQAAQP